MCNDSWYEETHSNNVFDDRFVRDAKRKLGAGALATVENQGLRRVRLALLLLLPLDVRLARTLHALQILPSSFFLRNKGYETIFFM